MLLVKVYTGSELLARIPIQKWDEEITKDLLNCIESHVKEPFSLLYSFKPLLTIILIVEFLDNLSARSNHHKNRCVVLK